MQTHSPRFNPSSTSTTADDKAYYAHLPFVLASSTALQASLDIYNPKPYAPPPLPPSSLPLINDSNTNSGVATPGTGNASATVSGVLPRNMDLDLDIDLDIDLPLPINDPDLQNQSQAQRGGTIEQTLEKWSLLLPTTARTSTAVREMTFYDQTPGMHNPGVRRDVLIARFEVEVQGVVGVSVCGVEVPSTSAGVGGGGEGEGGFGGDLLGQGEEGSGVGEEWDGRTVWWVWVVVRWGDGNGDESAGTGEAQGQKKGRGKEKSVCFAIPESAVQRLTPPHPYSHPGTVQDGGSSPPPLLLSPSSIIALKIR
ncbi:hypothetical protein MMC16_003472 [Acarospora aff. strigata]|nr:hypothetical protein [Acarospora aff. strigata]